MSTAERPPASPGPQRHRHTPPSPATVRRRRAVAGGVLIVFVLIVALLASGGGARKKAGAHIFAILSDIGNSESVLGRCLSLALIHRRVAAL